MWYPAIGRAKITKIAMEVYTVESVIRGHQVYKSIAFFDEPLPSWSLALSEIVSYDDAEDHWWLLTIIIESQ